MTKRVQGYSGQSVNNTVDLKFIRIGETKRTDVLQNLIGQTVESKTSGCFGGDGLARVQVSFGAVGERSSSMTDILTSRI